MTTGKSNTDKFFHDVAVNYTESPPHYSWKNLADSLTDKKKKKRIVYFRLAAAVIALIFAFSIGYFYSGFRNKKEEILLANDKTKVEKQSIAETENIINTLNQETVAGNQTADITEAETSELNIAGNNPSPKTKLNKTPRILNKTQFVNTPKNNAEKINVENRNTQIAQNPAIEKNSIADTTSKIQTEITKEEVATNSTNKSKLDSIILNQINDIINSQITNPIAPNEPQKESRWSVGGELAPTYSFRTSSNSSSNKNASANSTFATSNSPNTYNEMPLITYSGGFNTRYKLSKRWSFQSGVYYSKFGHTSDFDVLTRADQSIYTNTSAGHLPLSNQAESLKPSYGSNQTADLENNHNLIQYFDYLEIPLAIRYKLIDRKIDFNVFSGVYTGFLVGNNAYLNENNTKANVGKTEDINTMIYNSMLGFGIEYELSKKVTINLEPLFKYSLKSINKGSDYIYKPYSFGIFTGVNYKL